MPAFDGESTRFVTTSRYELFIADYLKTREMVEVTHTEITKNFATLNTKIDFYQEELTDLRLRVTKLETFKSVVMAAVVVSGTLGGLIGILFERFVLK